MFDWMQHYEKKSLNSSCRRQRTHTILVYILAIFLASTTTLQAATNTKAEHRFPTSDWVKDEIQSDAGKKARKLLEEVAFPSTNPNPDKPPIVTDALLVIKDGKILYERYENGYGPDQRHINWSVSKSVTSLLLGIAIKEGKVSLEDSICKYLKPNTKNQCDIKVLHVARHSTGLDWVETYEKSKDPTDSAVLAMLYGSGMKDVVRFVLDRHKAEVPPGTRWRYSSGDSNLLSAILQKAYGAKAFNEVIDQKLFQSIGITSAIWERDENDTIIGSSYLYLKPRDMARIGLLALANGRWEDKQLFPETWMEFSTTHGPAVGKSPPWPSSDGRTPETYGAHWWLNQAHPKHPKDLPWPDLPTDGYAAMGHWGQYIFVLPSLNTIVVRTGNDRGPRLHMNALLKHAAEMVRYE